MVTDQEITEAIAVEKTAHDAFVVARAVREGLQVQQASERYSIRVGDKVQDDHGRQGIVTRIKPWSGSKPWIYAAQIKKDGNVGDRELSMYENWRVVA